VTRSRWCGESNLGLYLAARVSWTEAGAESVEALCFRWPPDMRETARKPSWTLVLPP